MKKKSKPVVPLTRFLIGRYQLGWRMVNVYADPNLLGGHFNLCRHGAEPQITIGMDHRSADESYGVLVHETLEMLMDDMGCAFIPKVFETNASDTYRFMFNHNQHTEISSRAAHFFWQCWNEFNKAFDLCRKNKNLLLKQKVKRST
jgi:hypothetical protein